MDKVHALRGLLTEKMGKGHSNVSPVITIDHCHATPQATDCLSLPISRRFTLTVFPRFCTACGSPLSPGKRFCEECGQPVDGTLPPPSPVLPVVVPFGTVRGGFLSQKDVLLVIGGDSLLVVVPPPGMAKSLQSLHDSLSKALEENGILPRDFWEVSASLDPRFPRAYWAPRQVPGELRTRVASIRSRLGLDHPLWSRLTTLSGDEILAECPGSWQIPLAAILYVRGEDRVEESSGEDLLVVRTAERKDHIWFSLGCYYPARVTLGTRIQKRWGIDLSRELIGSIVPACFEPGPEDFGFQYVFSLIFTNQQLLLAITPGSEDEVERRWESFMESLRKGAKEKGVALEAYAAGADRTGAPWQIFRRMSPAEILDSDGVNYTIPYVHLRAVTYHGGKRPKIVLSLPSHTIELEADPLFAAGSLREAQRALQGKVTISL